MTTMRSHLLVCGLALLVWSHPASPQDDFEDEYEFYAIYWECLDAEGLESEYQICAPYTKPEGDMCYSLDGNGTDTEPPQCAIVAEFTIDSYTCETSPDRTRRFQCAGGTKPSGYVCELNYSSQSFVGADDCGEE